MADRHRGVLGKQQQSGGLTHDVAAADDDGVLSGNGISLRFKISISPAGVHGASAGRPPASLPTFIG